MERYFVVKLYILEYDDFRWRERLQKSLKACMKSKESTGLSILIL